MPAEDPSAQLRRLPSVDEVLARPAIRALAERIGRLPARDAARAAVAAARAKVLSGVVAPAGAAGVGAARSGSAGSGAAIAGAAISGAADELVTDAAVEAAAHQRLQPRLRPVLNATGIVLHTNLGRSPLHAEVAARVAQVAAGYCNLELDLETGKRGSRHAVVEPLLRELFSAEAAHVVGNCAGATLLALGALGAGGAAVVSRSELVEIGGGFRVPDILAQSGCKLVEVGTTNRTHLRDYEAALDQLKAAGTQAMILRVHRSNFALVGFTTEPSTEELAALAKGRKVPFVHDLGSGAVESPVAEGLPQEPTAKQSLKAGADLVLISGDKLLGGPQAGMILGKKAAVEKCRKHPLARALRPDKLVLAALEATLDLYRQGRSAELPAIAAMGASGEALRQRATRLALLLGERGAGARVVECEGRVGGGSLPQARLPSWGVAVSSPASARGLLANLRQPEGDLPAVLAILRDGDVIFDVRCVPEEKVLPLALAVVSALGRQPPEATAKAAVEAAEDAFGPESATLDE